MGGPAGTRGRDPAGRGRKGRSKAGGWGSHFQPYTCMILILFSVIYLYYFDSDADVGVDYVSRPRNRGQRQGTMQEPIRHYFTLVAVALSLLISSILSIFSSSIGCQPRLDEGEVVN